MPDYPNEVVFFITMGLAVVWLAVAIKRGGRLWRPKDPKSIVVIKITLWAGLLTWMIFSLSTSILMARLASVEILRLVPGTKGTVYSWVVPIWIIFTTLMLIWATSRYAVRKLRGKVVGKKLRRKEARLS